MLRTWAVGGRARRGGGRVLAPQAWGRPGSAGGKATGT
jgi:hypothetical protein